MGRKSPTKQLTQSKTIQQNSERTEFIYNRQNELEAQVKANTGLIKELERTKADQSEIVDLGGELEELDRKVGQILLGLEDVDKRLEPWWKQLFKWGK